MKQQFGHGFRIGIRSYVILLLMSDIIRWADHLVPSVFFKPEVMCYFIRSLIGTPKIYSISYRSCVWKYQTIQGIIMSLIRANHYLVVKKQIEPQSLCNHPACTCNTATGHS